MACVSETFHHRSPYGTFRLHLPEDSLVVSQRAQRQKVTGRFPPTLGIHDIISFQERDESKFRVYSDVGERRAEAPRRQETPVVDPTSGFTSVGADAEDGNHKSIEPLVCKDHRPQSAKPYGRPIASPTPELRTINAPWESKNKELESYAHPQSGQSFSEMGKVTVNEMIKNKEWRDAIATRAFYTSQTQRLYNGVDWANKLPPAIDPPPTTLEYRPDMVSQKFSIKRYDARPEMWQHLGSRPHSWDYLQSRNGNYVYGNINYCSPNRKTGHVPGYTGCTAGLHDKDHPGFDFGAIALVRSHKPRFTHISKRGNIPGYTGHTHYSSHHPAHSKEPQPRAATTARTHRKLQVPSTLNVSPFKRDSLMSKMVTLVHPFNPFNKID